MNEWKCVHYYVRTAMKRSNEWFLRKEQRKAKSRIKVERMEKS